MHLHKQAPLLISVKNAFSHLLAQNTKYKVLIGWDYQIISFSVSTEKPDAGNLSH